MQRETFLENVYVETDGSLDFSNLERTSNGRAVIERRDFMHAGDQINAERVDNLFIITRGNIIPAIAKLTHEQARLSWSSDSRWSPPQGSDPGGQAQERVLLRSVPRR